MAINSAMEMEITPTGVLCTIGGILMILGVALSWMDIGLLGSVSSHSGWDIVLNDDIEGIVRFSPAVCIVSSILVFTLDTFFISNRKSKMKKIMSLATILIAAISIVFIIMFTGDIPSNDIDIAGYDVLSSSVGVGAWIALAGSVMSAMGGVLGLRS